MLKRMLPLVFVVGGVLAQAGSSAAEPAKNPAAGDDSVVQKVGHGEINWSKKTVTATGSGAANLKDGSVAQARLMAERAAKIDALRNIVETIQGITVSGQRSAGDVMSNGEIRTRVTAVAQGFKVVDTKYYSDGSVDVVVSMPIDENLTSALVEKPKKARTVKADGAAPFTGLVVNARGLGVTPSMAPRVLDDTLASPRCPRRLRASHRTVAARSRCPSSTCHKARTPTRPT